MEDKYIKLSFPVEGVALMEFKQPTFTIDFVRSINEGLDFLLKKDNQPLTLVTTSQHPKIYCAGLNFAIFSQHPQDVHNNIAEIVRLFGRFLSLPFPSIALINGHALAGGMMLIMSHDYRICVQDEALKIGMTEIKLGMTIPDGMMAPLDAKLEKVVMREICLEGKIVNSQEAKAKNIVDVTAPREKLMQIGME